jgi:hypothetical protein
MKDYGGESRVSGPQSLMLRLLKKMGFRYRKCNDGRKFLMERSK